MVDEHVVMGSGALVVRDAQEIETIFADGGDGLEVRVAKPPGPGRFSTPIAVPHAGVIPAPLPLAAELDVRDRNLQSITRRQGLGGSEDRAIIMPRGNELRFAPLAYEMPTRLGNTILIAVTTIKLDRDPPTRSIGIRLTERAKRAQRGEERVAATVDEKRAILIECVYVPRACFAVRIFGPYGRLGERGVKRFPMNEPIFSRRRPPRRACDECFRCRVFWRTAAERELGMSDENECPD